MKTDELREVVDRKIVLLFGNEKIKRDIQYF